MSSPLKAIREKCLACCNDSYNEVRSCTVESCPLFYFRFGKNPNRKVRKMSDEQKAAAIERLKRARTAKAEGIVNVNFINQ